MHDEAQQEQLTHLWTIVQLEVDQTRASASNLSNSLACYLIASQQLKGPAANSTQLSRSMPC